MLEISEVVYADPQNHLANMAFARRMANHALAVELENLAAYARANADEMFAYLEVATALHISDRAAQRRMAFAVALTERLPRTMAEFRQGRLEDYKAQLICEAVTPLSDDQALQVEKLVVDKAAEQTAVQLRYALNKAVLRVDPVGAEQRRLLRQQERRVESRPTEDGQAMLSLHHSADRIAAIKASITAQARQLKAVVGSSAPWRSWRPTSWPICCSVSTTAAGWLRCTSPCPPPPHSGWTINPARSRASRSPGRRPAS